MNRRSFFGILAGATAAASVTVKAKPKGPDWLIRWTDLGIRVQKSDTRRLSYLPHGPLDFLQLPAPIIELMVTDFGVSFHCANGCLYHLNGHPGFQETWTIRAVADIYSIAPRTRNY